MNLFKFFKKAEKLNKQFPFEIMESSLNRDDAGSLAGFGYEDYRLTIVDDLIKSYDLKDVFKDDKYINIYEDEEKKDEDDDENFVKKSLKTAIIWLTEQYVNHKNIKWKVQYEWQGPDGYSLFMGIRDVHWSVLCYENGIVDLQKASTEALMAFIKLHYDNYFKDKKEDDLNTSIYVREHIIKALETLKYLCVYSLNQNINEKIAYSIHFAHEICLTLNKKVNNESDVKEKEIAFDLLELSTMSSNVLFQQGLDENDLDSIRSCSADITQKFTIEKNALLYNDFSNDFMKNLMFIHRFKKFINFYKGKVDVNRGLIKLKKLANETAETSKKSILKENEIIILNSEPEATPPENNEKENFNQMVENLKTPFSLTPISQNIIKQLKEEFPWAENVCDCIENHINMSIYLDRKYFQLPPILLVGPPGNGKTYFVQRLSELSENKCLVMSASNSDGTDLQSAGRFWGNTNPNALLRFISNSKIANPIIVYDELDKTKDADYMHCASVFDQLLLFLEKHTAKNIRDSYLLADINYSYCTWIAMANDKTKIPSYLLSRFIILDFNKPLPKHLPQITQSIRRDIAKNFETNIDRIPEITHEDQDYLLKKLGSQMSIREIRMACENLINQKIKNIIQHKNTEIKLVVDNKNISNKTENNVTTLKLKP
jgi:hypothetical protein